MASHTRRTAPPITNDWFGFFYNILVIIRSGLRILNFQLLFDLGIFDIIATKAARQGSRKHQYRKEIGITLPHAH